MAASKQEASSIDSKNKGVVVDMQIPGDGTGSDHMENQHKFKEI